MMRPHGYNRRQMPAKNPDSDRLIAIERTVPHGPDAVYRAFSDPARLAKWWGPNGFTNTFEVFEFSEGGVWNFVMHGPDGSHHRNESVFLALEPGRKLVIRHACPPLFTLTVTLLPDGTGTKVLWSALFDDAEVLAAIRHFAEPGGEQNLDRLTALLAGGAG